MRKGLEPCCCEEDHPTVIVQKIATAFQKGTGQEAFPPLRMLIRQMRRWKGS
jgi:hypothetical protein